jgi:hypothetical protein
LPKATHRSLDLGKPHFEQRIPAAIANLTEVCAEGEALEELRTLFAGGV